MSFLNLAEALGARRHRNPKTGKRRLRGEIVPHHGFDQLMVVFWMVDLGDLVSIVLVGPCLGPSELQSYGYRAHGAAGKTLPRIYEV